MNTVMEDGIKRWTAKRKAALVLDIIQGKTTISEASRAFDLNPSEVEQWVDEGKRGMENALRTKSLWPAAGVHHPVQPGAKQHGRACDQNAQRPMRALPPIGDPAVRQPRDRRLDRLCNHRRPHQALGMKTPAEAYALAA